MLYYYPPHHTKLGKPYSGPFLVVRRVSAVHYMLQQQEGGRLKRVHVDSLKLCHFLPGQEPRNWIPLGTQDLAETEGECTGHIRGELKGPPDGLSKDLPADDEERDRATFEEMDEEPLDDAAGLRGNALDAEESSPRETVTRRSGRTSKPPLRLDL